MNEQLKALAELLQLVHDEAGKIPPQFSAIRIATQNSSKQLMNRINGINGGAMVTHGKGELPPLESILGEKVNRPQPVTQEQLKPDSIEVAAFTKKRDELYDNFPAENAEVLKREHAVIKAVAKKAGVLNYKDAKVDNKFIDSIRQAIVAKK